MGQKETKGENPKKDEERYCDNQARSGVTRTQDYEEGRTSTAIR